MRGELEEGGGVMGAVMEEGKKGRGERREVESKENDVKKQQHAHHMITGSVTSRDLNILHNTGSETTTTRGFSSLLKYPSAYPS